MNKNFEKHLFWIENLNTEVINFLSKLQKKESKFTYYPALEGLTEEGKKLNLGFSCFAAKIKYILNEPKDFNDEEKKNWSDYINSFQKEINSQPKNSYIDDNFLQFHESQNYIKFTKNNIKKLLNKTNYFDFNSEREDLVNYIKAETKQAISTIYEMGQKNILPYYEFPKEINDINKYLNNLNWSLPWTSGAQFAALCVFTQTQLTSEKEHSINSLVAFSDKLVNKKNGFYYLGNINNQTQLINGAMKILTGLHWIEKEIHYPEKLIDFCLNTEPNSEGCDLVDIVYVLYRCSLQTEYKLKEIKDYLVDLIDIIESHYFKNQGGFSYYQDKSQIYYYGLKITKGTKTPDIHGTILLVWALSMIFDVIGYKEMNWNILKP
tara:strand:- start:236 stop:1372 length:1137 start_codon:yes stop_codon:yes gene_type:complete